VNLRYLDSQGRVKSQEIRINDVMLLDGSPYSRLVARDDRPLPPAEERKEQERLARSIAERRLETAAQRAQRLSEYGRRPEWQREAWRELPEAFSFRLTGEEVRNGRSLYVIEAAPRRGYQPPSRTAKMLAHSGPSFGWTSGLPPGERGGGGCRHHLGGGVPGPRGQGLGARRLSRPRE